jgi:predicted nucleotidyltransferase
LKNCLPKTRNFGDNGTQTLEKAGLETLEKAGLETLETAGLETLDIMGYNSLSVKHRIRCRIRGNMEQTITPENAAKEILTERYPNAKVMFLAGSLVRGESTRFSDLDLVVVFDHVNQASRESFYYRGWPVEAFIHDVETLKYFFVEIDAKSAFAALPQMVTEGKIITDDNELSFELKKLAQEVLDKGPPELDQVDLDKRRYEITDLIDDIREPRSRAELMASGGRLLQCMADFYFRSNGMWSASGKTIFRKLAAADSKMLAQFEFAFAELFAEANPAPCIELAEKLLKNKGGFLFDGYKHDAPTDWRVSDDAKSYSVTLD